MKIVSLAAIAALGLAVSGCASIVEGTTQDFAVNTTPKGGASCTLTNSEGTWHVTTPGTARVHKTKHDLVITCALDGYKTAHRNIESHFNGATAGNVIAGGIIGIGIDAATGANFNYPADATLELEPLDAASAAPPVNAAAAPATVTAPEAVAKPAS